MRFTILSFILLMLASCSNDKNKPDISKIKVDLSVQRFEKDFFAIDTNKLAQGLQQLNSRHSRFYPFFINNILLLNQNANTQQQGGLELSNEDANVVRTFYRWYRPIYDSLQEKYPKLDWLEEDLEEAFRYVKFYYPSYPIPEVVTFIGTFDAPGVTLTPKYLGLGLQQFAGRNFSAYQDPGIQQMYPEYISRRFDKAYIPARCMMAVVDDLYPDTTQSGKLIEMMIEKGKQWYLLDHFLPDAPDSLKTGYTKAQTEWLKENEGNIWGSILQNTPDLYTVDAERVQNYIGESPRTTDMPESSPGNIGQWVGWQIVKTFASKNPSLTIPQVMATPSNKIFAEAKYKPK